MKKRATELVAISDDLSKKVGALAFQRPVHYVYNPLQYAREPLVQYIQKYAVVKTVLWVGMNPGPFGMAQTGVPFGDISMVRDFLQIQGRLRDLPLQHPKRPIEGFDCARSEVSGTRLWGFAREKFKTPESFFSNFFVVNYCPLVFMGETGKNITPDKLPAVEKEALFDACDEALRRTAIAMKSPMVIGVGAFARGVCERSLDGLNIPVGQLLHPSPASPAANRGWAAAAEKQLKQMKLL
ncbi:MAG: single-stranded DNA-binding protein [Deltaproteobacteria bacterium]|nr:single-stranded DNA-binding protein [Deltaproteobacteria bacterium]MBN2672431.1 single-stranded DNA-binding protein [Deltaproteobacteria bacterium]